MKFGIMYANAGPSANPEFATDFCQGAESSGFESLWTVEHTVIPTRRSTQYPYAEDGRMPGPDDIDIPEPLVWLAFAAGVTSSIRLGTGMLILPLRNPLALAKTAATLDRLSGGRFMLGLGTGWLREEFDALGVPWERRGARSDDYINAMRAAWRDDPSSFEGSSVRYRDIRVFPKPTSTTVPLVIGGHTTRAARRAGLLGDGFFPGTPEPDAVAALVGDMRAAATSVDRDPRSIEVTVGVAELSPRIVDQYSDLGVERIVLAPRGASIERRLESLHQLADQCASLA